MSFTINISGKLLDLSMPKVMGILNVTPDSFYSSSRNNEAGKIRSRIKEMIDQGVDIIDVGGCSTRPGYTEVTPEEEWQRLALGCEILREIDADIPLSIDTFRASLAEKAVTQFNANIINDVSGGRDPEMWDFVASQNVPYVLTHFEKEDDSDPEDITAHVITLLSKKVNELHRKGVNDVIIDPGFGFGKSIEENFALLSNLDQIVKMGLPVLAGISRKSMIYKSLGISPEDALEGTVALNSVALLKGANILRVHDVKAAKETVKLFTLL